MAFSYLTEDNLSKEFKNSKQAMAHLFEPFPEYDRLSRNLPHPSIDKAHPRVTDGTLASIIQESPKRVVQQVPTSQVETGEEYLDIYAEWKLNKDILPNSNHQADALQKSWRAGSNCLTFGSSPAYVFMNQDGTKTDFSLPYITHVYLQRGKFSDKDSNFIFLGMYYQESDIDEIIDAEEQHAKEDKDYKTEWDLEKLKEAKSVYGIKEEEHKTHTEKKSDNDSGGIFFVYALQKGAGNTFYMFVPKAGDNEEIIVRRKVSKDPRGVIPIHYWYLNLDLSNPLGRGICEMSGSMQNLLDSHVQAFQYMQALEMNPPIVTKGNIPRGAVKYVPNSIIHLGDVKNASIEPLRISTHALTAFPTTYGLIKSQILNLNNSTDTSISAEVGNPGFSKTDAGVKALSQKLGVSDNYLRKQYESWIEAISETSLNLTFAEVSGIITETLDKRTADKLRRVIPEGNDVITWKEKDGNIILVDYDKLGEEPLVIKTNASTSSLKEESEQLEALVTGRELVLDKLPKSKQMLFMNKMINALGIEDSDDIAFSKDEIDSVIEAERNPQEPEDPKAPELTPEEQELITGLQARGASDAQIEQAVMLLREGKTIDEIIQILVGA